VFIFLNAHLLNPFNGCLLTLILNIFNGKKKFKICHHGEKQNYKFDYNLGPPTKKKLFINLNHIRSQY
jgi:hypothetical protein